MPTYDLPGGQLYYLELGAGPPLVLVHGWPVSSVYWRPNLSRLSESFHVLAVDLPGFGRSYCPGREGCRASQQAARLASFIRDVAGGPAFLIGHSMGGMISANLAIREPGLVRRLVLVTAPVEGVTGLSSIAMLARFGWARRIAAWALGFGPARRFAAPWFSHAIGLPEEILLACAEASGPSARSALETLTHDGTRDELAGVRSPTLVIAGDRDRIVNPLQPLLAKGWIPGARLEVFRDCGHCPNVEYPALFHDTVLEFLFAEAPVERPQPPASGALA